jgi:uncharacterized protein with GYD domain
MPYFLVQVAYTASSAKAMTDRPHDRTEIVRKSVESCGGKLHQMFFALGEFDVVLIAELPGNHAAAALGLATSSTGALSKYQTTALLTAQEAVQAMTMAKKIVYTPPR